MAVYEYQGYDTSGKKASGAIDAESPKAARSKLRGQGILATQISSGTGGREMLKSPLGAVMNRIGAKDVTAFTRNLTTLLAGGLPLVESLDSLRDQTTNVRFKRVVTDIRESVAQGSSLADALSKHPGQFDSLYVNLVRAGEASGALDRTLSKLAVFQEERLRQRRRITGAMVYPAIMTIVGCSVLFFLLTHVMPKIQPIFEDMSQALPLPTVILLFVSEFLGNWWPALLIAMALAVFAGSKYIKTEAGRQRLDRALLRMPVLGGFIRSAAIARFASALSVLLSGGVTLIEAMRVTGDIAGNSLIKSAIDQAIVNITEGQAIAEPFRRSGVFPPLVTRMIDAGERSGSLTEMLERIADAYDFEVETGLSTLVSLVEPVMILLMGGAVGFIVMAILLPIFELSQMAG